MEENEKKNWLQTSVSNKIGTILWAISTALFIIVFINILNLSNMIATISQDAGWKEMGSSLGKFFIPMIIFYLIITICIFLNFNTATAIGKAYGISLLIFDIMAIVGTITLTKLVLPILAGKISEIQTLENAIENVFDNIRDLLIRGSKTLKKFGNPHIDATKAIETLKKTNSNLISAIEGLAGYSLSDDELYSTILVILQMYKKFAIITIGAALTQLFTFIAGFMLKTDNTQKSRLAALIMCLFMGFVGGHLLYIGKTGKAILRTICTMSIVLLIIPAFFGLIDFILILAGKFKDKTKQPVVKWI